MVQGMGMEWRRRLFSDCRSVTDLRYRDWCSSSCLEVRCIFWILFLASWQLSCEARSPFILKLVEIFRGLVAIGECVTFAWIPSHVGVHGSTVVDREARDALDEPVSNCSVPCMYFDPFMAKCILGCLQDSCRNSDERQQHPRSQVEHVQVNNRNHTEHPPVAPHYSTDNHVPIYYVQHNIWSRPPAPSMCSRCMVLSFDVSFICIYSLIVL
jgi:hypothetical protein